MSIMNWKCLSFTFFIICLIGTIGLSLYSMHRYFKDEDITLVKITKFLSSKDAIYPSFSFCIMSPFLESNFKVYGDDSINMTSYTEFLDGTLWDDRFLRVDYDNVTASLLDNLVAAKYATHQGNFINWTAHHYVSFRSPKRKCFTIDAPLEGTELTNNFEIKVKQGIIRHGKGYRTYHQRAKSQNKKIATYIHYPGQRFTAYYTIGFPSRQAKGKIYQMKFRVKNIEVITRRNKIHEPCEEDWKHSDQHIMEELMIKAGCCPPHWKTNLDLPICSYPNQMKSFSKEPTTAEMESYIQPCRVINELDYIYSESKTGVGRWKDTYFRIITSFHQTTFIERTQVQEYTLDDLVGTCGGYIGMFLGYALVQFPQFLQFVFRIVKQRILVRSAQQ